MTADLLFWRTKTDANLVFGDSAAPEVPHYTADLAATLPALTFTAQAIPTSRAILVAALPELTLSAEARYASETSRPTVGQSQALHQVARLAEVGVVDGFGHTDPTPSGAEQVWQAASSLAVTHGDRYVDAGHLQASRRARHQDATSRHTKQIAHYQDATAVRQSRSSRHQESSARRLSRSARHQDGIRTKAASASRYQDGHGFEFGQHESFQKAAPWVVNWRGEYQDAQRPQAGQHIDAVTPVTPIPAWTTDLLFSKPWGGTGLIFGWKNNNASSTIVVPVRSVYIVINDISLRRVSNGIALPPTSFSFSIDRDSWTWSFNAAFPLRTQSDLEPDSNGAPVELLAEINGNAYRFVVESITRDRAFPSGSISVSGRGRSAFLDSPYAPSLNFTNSAARTAQQLMADALTYNGASIGWDIDWGITDWLVPAGAWAHQGSYISALKTIAEAAGAYLQPHATLQQMRVLPAYPIAPWEWSTVTPDIELPSAVTTREGVEWARKADYNGVYLAGSILGRVIRAGTAGDDLAPMVTDPLITHADAARQRGIAILGDTGLIASLSLSLPVLPETGIIVPGIMPNYIDNGTERLGIVRSTSVSVQYPSVRQTIGVEAHVA